MKLFCKHEWNPAGWSYLRCKKCNKQRYDPEKNAELRRPIFDKMCNSNIPGWDKDKMNQDLMRRGHFEHLI